MVILCLMGFHLNPLVTRNESSGERNIQHIMWPNKSTRRGRKLLKHSEYSRDKGIALLKRAQLYITGIYCNKTRAQKADFRVSIAQFVSIVIHLERRYRGKLTTNGHATSQVYQPAQPDIEPASHPAFEFSVMRSWPTVPRQTTSPQAAHLSSSAHLL